eukprot:TRINITY_DN8964_c0_g1_i1.p1 TRINITY_DN8964_c0_g1~~TRINITY_DN8964_c0_g1_i1.p1  ORF type:complete len:131 (+),score=8.99 TRINITY_DN8964_c0_g1_i1:43-435(+)
MANRLTVKDIKSSVSAKNQGTHLYSAMTPAFLEGMLQCVEAKRRDDNNENTALSDHEMWIPVKEIFDIVVPICEETLVLPPVKGKPTEFNKWLTRIHYIDQKHAGYVKPRRKTMVGCMSSSKRDITKPCS